ncbi:DNAJ heat shock N-terminal domain-containing protein [Tieghemostelium lacteum]|uniref:DNAJ heat shock N-terminal domain-containing protein n=1 Tax=Tieghemostelium lacteum TaxID=361077 RepID=A0A151ZGG3_TIELA|nr:DNAJ heat shock N-terminal domain-containing protein [Tieghemostelium lacteum]|eukprot:KYQ93061.1 DNAJ heat shock N-terminal domain-containing protein [Tieghemostelium lacteum]
MDTPPDTFQEFNKENKQKSNPSIINDLEDNSDIEEDDVEELIKKQNEIDFYALLNVSRDATVDEIKNSYKKLAFTYHPDKQFSEELKQLSQDQFSLISLAKDTLCDPKLRAIYDEFGFDALQNSKAIVNKYEEIDNLIKAIDRIQKQIKEDKLLQDMYAQGQQSIKISYNHEYRLFQFNSYRSMQTFKFASKIGIIDFTPTIKYDRQQVTPELDINYNYAFSNKNHINISHKLSDIMKLSKITFTSLVRPDIIGSLQCTLFRGIPVEGGVSLTKNLNETLQATVSASSGVTQHLISMNLKRTVEKRIFDVTLSAGSQSQLEASVSRRVPISNGSTIGIVLSAHHGFYSLFDQSLTSISAVVTKRISRVFQMSLTMQYTPTKYQYILGFHHKYQSFEIPIPIYTDISLFNSLLFFTIPSVTLSLMKLVFINPLLRKSDSQKLDLMKRSRYESMSAAKKKAEIDIQLMTPTVQKKILQEQTKNGLIIQEAIYGILNEKPTKQQKTTTNEEYMEFPPFINVTIPLQYLVEDSKLSLHPNKKSDLLGFWDPRIDISDGKQLKVTYFFQNKLHRVTVNEYDQLVIPLRSHLINN